jgi:hypothetical protein
MEREMGAIGDVTNEFKQAGPKEKAVIIIAVIGVAGVAYYLYTKQKGSTAAPTAGSSSASLPAGYPLAGSTPVLPAGVNPLYDPNGNLIAFQNPSPTVPSPPPTPTTPTPPKQTPLIGQPSNWYTNFLGKIGYGTHISPGGVDQNGQRFWYAPNSYFYAPKGSTIAYGGLGRVWLQLPNGQQHQLLTGSGVQNSSMHAQSTTVAKTAAMQRH